MEMFQTWMYYFWYCMTEIRFTVGIFNFSFLGVFKVGVLFYIIGFAISHLFMAALNARK